MDLTELAHGMKLFNGIDVNDVDRLLYLLNGVKKTCRKGEIVVHAGMDANRLLAVASGHLHVYTETPGENPILVREIAADEVLGLWVLHVPEVACWPGTIVAAEDSLLVSLDLNSMRRLLASGKPPASRLSANMSKLLAAELFHTWRKLMVMNAATIEARVMVYLTELDNESGSTGQVVVPFNRERMAEYLGVARPSLSRALGSLRNRGALTWSKNVFRIGSRR